MGIEPTFPRSREGTAALKAGTGTSTVTSPFFIRIILYITKCRNKNYQDTIVTAFFGFFIPMRLGESAEERPCPILDGLPEAR
jgi:hypothetical protein